MLRRVIFSTAALLLAALTAPQTASATAAILPSGSATPLEQRIAVAVSPSRTTVWTNLRLDSAVQPVGLLVPVPSGTALDHSSDAWIEALDDATAPRVFPPMGASYVCPGTLPDPMADPFHLTTFPGPIAGLAPTQSTVLPDVPAVLAWASINGFSISPATKTALENMPGMRFFVERFEPKVAPFFTSTLRFVLPNSTPVLPLALTRAGASDLRVTAWFVGAGRANLTGSLPVKLQVNDLQWSAKTQTSDYIELRDAALLAAGASANITEASSHDALVKNVAIAEGKGAITGVVTGYFQRTADYLDGNADPNACILSSAAAFDGTLNVARVCPRANLGVVDGSPPCVEAPAGSEVDPAKLRCGGRADDLAVALSELQPMTTWLTRMTLVVPKDTSGQTLPITFTAVAPTVEPIATAASIGFAGCDGMGSSGSTSGGSSGNGTSSGSPGPWNTSSSGGTGNGAPVTPEPNYDSDMSCGCGPAAAPIITGYGGSAGYGGDGGFAGNGGAGGDVVYEDTSSDDCSGDTTESTDPYADSSSSDDCGGDTSESTDPYADSSSSDDCGGDTTESTSSSDTSSDGSIDCSGDSSGGGGSSGGASDYTDTSSSDSSDSSDCTIARHPRAKPSKRGPKASMLTLGLLAILAPLRRITRPRRRSQQQDKPELRRG